MSENRPVETVDQGRQGETSNHMRWVLLASLVLAVAVVGGIWLWLIPA